MLGTVLKHYPGMATNLQRLEFKSPIQPFAHRWNQLVEAPSEIQDSTANSHFLLLHGNLHAELRDAITVENDLAANRVIRFKYLWTIVQPGSLVYSIHEGHERCYELSSSSESYDSARGLALLTSTCTSTG